LDILKSLRAAVDRDDRHDPKIEGQKGALIARAIQWHLDGKLTENQRDEIVFIAENAAITDWRPLLYIIPREKIEPERIVLVKIDRRAGLGPEYIIENLQGNEFEVIEV